MPTISVPAAEPVSVPADARSDAPAPAAVSAVPLPEPVATPADSRSDAVAAP